MSWCSRCERGGDEQLRQQLLGGGSGERGSVPEGGGGTTLPIKGLTELIIMPP